jgi:hypothetical protein
MMKIIDGKPDENKVYRGLSAPAKDLLARLLDPNPETRYTYVKSYFMYVHYWITTRKVRAVDNWPPGLPTLRIDQALAHPWLNGKDAPDTPLPEIQAEVRSCPLLRTPAFLSDLGH